MRNAVRISHISLLHLEVSIRTRSELEWSGSCSRRFCQRLDQQPSEGGYQRRIRIMVGVDLSADQTPSFETGTEDSEALQRISEWKPLVVVRKVRRVAVINVEADQYYIWFLHNGGTVPRCCPMDTPYRRTQPVSISRLGGDSPGQTGRQNSETGAYTRSPVWF